MSIWHTKLVGLVCAAGAILISAAAATAADFVVLGDMPYGEDQVQSLKQIGKKIGKATPDIDFVIHYGDLKSGGTPCTNGLMRAHLDAVFDLLPGRVFYTPGDNDWTDCDRPDGELDELERLAWLRQQAFSDNTPDVAAWHVARQADYPENARWQWHGLQFATLHIVGTENGRDEILSKDSDGGKAHRQRALDAVDARDGANLVWLNETFDRAVQADAAGVVIAMQSDPYDVGKKWRGDTPCSTNKRTHCHPYLTFLRQLTVRAAAFDRPVLLIHGSTNGYCLDRGFGGWQAPRLWRLNGPGDFVTIDAAVVRFDADSDLPFGVRGLLSGDRPPDCIYPR